MGQFDEAQNTARYLFRRLEGHHELYFVPRALFETIVTKPRSPCKSTFSNCIGVWRAVTVAR